MIRPGILGEMWPEIFKCDSEAQAINGDLTSQSQGQSDMENKGTSIDNKAIDGFEALFNTLKVRTTAATGEPVMPWLPVTAAQLVRQEELELMITVLKAHVVATGELYLSSLPLSAAQLTEVLGRVGEFRRLNVSGIESVTKPVLLQILETHGSMRWLDIYACPISNADIYDLMTNHPTAFHSIGTIIHPTFFSAASLSSLPPSFQVFSITGFRNPVHVTLPIFDVDSLAQMLLDIAKMSDNFAEWKSLTILGNHGSSTAQTFFTPSYREAAADWHDRAIESPAYTRRGDGMRLPLENGYTFIFWPDDRKRVVRYGFVLPGVSDTAVGVEKAFKHMEENGRGVFSDNGMMQKLLAAYDTANVSLITDIKACSHDLGIKVE